MAPPTRCPFFWNYHARRARPVKQIAEENRGTKTKENLRAVGAFEDFLNGEESNHGGDADGVPDELTPGGFDWWGPRHPHSTRPDPRHTRTPFAAVRFEKHTRPHSLHHHAPHLHLAPP